MENRKPPEYLKEADRNMAYKDELTGLFNRRLLTHLFQDFRHDLCRQDSRLSLLILDLDGFKAVNDRHGHLAGDAVLREVAAILKKTFRSSDIVVRYGGDEFVVIMPEAAASEAEKLGERARTELEHHDFGLSAGLNKTGPALSFSIGVAAFPEDGVSGFDILEKADKRLYEEKENRRALDREVRRKKRLRFLIPAAAAVLAVLAAAVFWNGGLLAPDTAADRPAAEAPVPEVLSSEREKFFTAEIERLRRELADQAALSNSRNGAPQRPALDADDVVRLKARLQELERELDRERETGSIEAPSGISPEDMVPENDLSEVTASGESLYDDPAGLERLQIVSPVLLEFEPPSYPQAALLFKREATVELILLVDKDGRVLEAEVVGPPAGFGFDEAARKAGLKAVYRPGQRHGNPAVMEARLAVNFRFRNGR